MADYKGLTIKIGGDTSGLTAALRAATKAASQTQAQLRAIDRAAKLDPSSIANAATRMKLAENRAQSLTAQLKTVNDQYRRLGSTASLSDPSKTIGNLASETKNAALQANLAQQRYNAVDERLASLYNSINKAARASKALGESFDLKKEADVDAAVEALRELGVVTQQDAERFASLRASWRSALNDLEDSKAVQSLERMRVKADSVTSEIKSMDAALARLNAPSALSASLKDTEAEVKRLDAELDRLSGSARQAEEALSLDPSSMDAARLKMQALAQSSELAQQKANLLRSAISTLESDGLVKAKADSGNLANEVSRAQAEVRRLSGEYREAATAVQHLQSEMRSLQQAGRLPDGEADRYAAELKQAAAQADALEAKLDQAVAAARRLGDANRLQQLRADLTSTEAAAAGYGAAMQGAGKKGGSMLSSVKSLGMTLSATLTPSILLAGGYAVSAASDMDAAYRDMRKTVNGTESDFERLKQSAIDFSSGSFTSAETVMQIQAIGGELGVATEALDTFAITVANLDIATNLDAEGAAASLGHLNNILNIGEQNMPRFGDALVRLGNNGASTEEQITEVATRIGSMGSIVGMSAPQILALASTIASTGQKSEAAGTAISNTMSDIETAVSGGGAQLQGFANVAGMSAEKFASTWKSNPVQAIQSFVEGLNGIEESGGSADSALNELGITGTRQKQAIMGLMKTIGLLDDNLTMSQNAWDGVSDQWGAAGDAAREADAKAQGFSGSLQRLANAAQNIASSAGDALAPVLSDLADAAADAVEWFDGLTDSQKRLVVGVAAVAAATGPALSIFASLGNVVRGVKENLTGMGSALGKVAGGLGRALAKLVPGAAGAAAGMEGMGAAAGGAGGLIGKLLSSAKGLIAAHPVITAGAVAAGGALALMAADAARAAERQKLLDSALKPVSETLKEAADSADELKASLVGIDVDSDGVLRSLAELNAETGETSTEIEVSARKADRYLSTIEELAGKSDLSAADQERLRQAVQGYNEATGSAVEVTDAQNGKLSQSTEELRKNTEQWHANAKARAYQEQAGKYLEKQIEAEMQLEEAERKRSELKQKMAEAEAKAMAAGNQTDKGRYAAEAAQYAAELKQLEVSVGDLTAANIAAAASYEYLSTQALIEQGALKGAAETMANAILTLGPEAYGTLSATGLSVAELSRKLVDAGVKTQTLQQVGSAGFAGLAAACNGNVGMMVAALNNYNSVPIVNKNGKVTADTVMLTDAQGKVYVWNGTTLYDKEGKVTAEVSGLKDAEGNIVDFNGKKLEHHEGSAKVKGNATDGTAKEKVDDTQESIDGMSDGDATATVDGNAVDGSASSAIDSTQRKIDSLRGNSVTVSVTTVETTVRRTVTAPTTSATPSAKPNIPDLRSARSVRASAIMTADAVNGVTSQMRALGVDAAVIRTAERLKGGSGGTVNNDNSRTTNISIGGVTYDDGSNVAALAEALVRALRLEGRR